MKNTFNLNLNMILPEPNPNRISHLLCFVCRYLETYMYIYIYVHFLFPVLIKFIGFMYTKYILNENSMAIFR